MVTRLRRWGFDPWVRKNRKWQPTPVFLPGKSHGRRSLVGYSPWGHKESGMTEHRTMEAVSQGAESKVISPSNPVTGLIFNPHSDHWNSLRGTPSREGREYTSRHEYFPRLLLSLPDGDTPSRLSPSCFSPLICIGDYAISICANLSHNSKQLWITTIYLMSPLLKGL